MAPKFLKRTSNASRMMLRTASISAKPLRNKSAMRACVYQKAVALAKKRQALSSAKSVHMASTKGLAAQSSQSSRGLSQVRSLSLKAKASSSTLGASRSFRRLRQKTEEALTFVDPVAFLKSKYGDMIPKRPPCPYFLFLADGSQRRKAQELLKNAEGMEERRPLSRDEGYRLPREGNLNAKLADMWKSLSPLHKAAYEQHHAREKAEFEMRNKVWQQSKEFREIDLLETKQREAKRSVKQAQKEAEQIEIRALLEDGVEALPDRGLQPGRMAILTGLVLANELNGKEVHLIRFDKALGRWVVKPTQLPDGSALSSLSLMNTRPQNLIWSVLIKEAEKAAQKQKEEIAKKQQREVDRAAKTELREAEKAIWQNEMQAVKDVHKSRIEAAREEKKNTEMAARAAAKEAGRAYNEAIKEAAKAAERAFAIKTPRQSMSAEMVKADCLD